MNQDEWLRRRMEAALLAGPLAESTPEPPHGPGAYTAAELSREPVDDAYDIVQAVLLALWREVSAREYREMQPSAREQYHVRMAEYFRSRAANESRLSTYFIARAVLHDQCAKAAVPKAEGLGEVTESLNRNVFLEVLGLNDPPL